MKKFVTLAIILSFLGLVGYKVYQDILFPEPASNGPGQRAQAVSVEPVRTETLLYRAEITGTLVAETSFQVAPRVSGRLEKLHVDIGDRAARGDIIAELDSEEFAQEVHMATAELELARAALVESSSELEVARKDLDRSQRLFERGNLSQSELDQAQSVFDVRQSRHDVAQAQVRQRQAALEAARVRLEYTTIRARWSGDDPTRRVARRFVDEGDMLQANEPIVTIICTRNLKAVINVIERDYPFISTGQSAVIKPDAFSDLQLEGTIIRLAPLLEDATRQARAEVLVPNPDGRLAPGMFVRVQIELGQRPQATAVPSAALARRNGSQGVFVAHRDTMQAHFVPVRTGLQDGRLVEIIEPELEGYVVTSGRHLLVDGADIVVPEGFRD